MKTRFSPTYDAYDRYPEEYGIIVTPEGGRIKIIVHGVPYTKVLSFEKRDWPDKELVKEKVFIDTENVDSISLEIYEVTK